MLTPPQQRVLWRLAQHKYGWGYVNGIGNQSAARALERRGLVEIADWDFRVTLTTAGEREANLRYPVSPLALGTYEVPENGWPLANV